LNENEKYEIIKKLVDTNGNKQRAAKKLGCSPRHIYRLINGYRTYGKAFFVHGNRGRKPSHTIPEAVKEQIQHLYTTKYLDCNLTHYQELLSQIEDIHISTSSISKILRNKYILSPLANRSTKRKLKEELKREKKSNKSKKKDTVINSALLTLEQAHPRRPRCAYFGEMLQMDASEHRWFGDRVTHLHIAVDDATGSIVGAYFDEQETLNGYYQVFHQVLTNYGIPYQFFTDRRTVFEYKHKKDAAVEKDTFTQFGYACKQLGVDIRTSSVPQTKGRVERKFHTLQSRLTVEMRLANVHSIKQANEFLKQFIKKFNKAFALPLHGIKSVFEKQPDDEKINLFLAVLSPRKIDNGSCLKYQKQYYLPVDSNGLAVHYRKGTTAMVIKAFDGELYTCINEQVYALEHLPDHQPSSKAFDLAPLPKEPKKRYVPPMSHPWKRDSFERFLKKQKHRTGVA